MRDTGDNLVPLCLNTNPRAGKDTDGRMQRSRVRR
jgi:hypothetical protein